MNFSNMKQLKKILSLVLAIAMMAALFAGCKKKNNDTPETSSEPGLILPTETTEPETEPTETEPPVINKKMATVLSPLYIRSSPSNEAAEVGKLEAGDKVEILQKNSALDVEWGLINIPGEEYKQGWVCMQFIEMDYKDDDTQTPGTPGDNKPADNTGGENGSNATGGNGSTTVLYRGTVTASELIIRKSSSINAEKVGTLRNGTRVEIFEKSGNWGRIKQGWISLDYVKLDNNDSNNNGNNNNSNNNTNNSNVGGNGNTTVISRGIVNTANLNIRASANVDSDKVGALTSGTRVEILEKSNGWGRIKQGWIALNYVYIDGTGTGNNKTGSINTDGLRIRSGPGTDYDVVGSLNSGDSVTILYQVTYGNTTWGNIKQGWISMAYVDGVSADGKDDNITWVDSENDKGESGGTVIASGVVTANGLNIRSSASGDADKVGSLPYGARVNILEKANGWGRVKQGWVNLDYVYLDGTGDGGDYGTITSGLNVRSGPGTNYGIVSSLSEGDRVTILFQITVDGMTWGNTKDGWVSMKYVNLD